MRCFAVVGCLVLWVGCSETESEVAEQPAPDVVSDVVVSDVVGADGDVIEAADSTEDSVDDDTPDGAADVEVELTPEWNADFLELGEEFVLRGVWGSSPDQLVAVGNKATIIEFNDGAWTVSHQNTELDTLNAVWGSAPDDVWAVGALGAILHKDETGWGIGTECANDAACEDGDSCTTATCSADGQCIFEGTGVAGCCGSLLANEAFEAPLAASPLGWTVTDTSTSQTGVVWQVVNAVDPATGAPRATSGTGALYFGNPNALCEDDPSKLCPNFDADDSVAADVTSELTELPDSAAITATFQVFIEGESSNNFDTLDLIVVSAGSVETVVWSKEEIGGNTGGVFVPATADLTDFAGQAVQFRFAFDSVDGLSNDGEGAYIDDFQVDSVCGALVESRFPTLWDIWGTASDNIYAVGNNGTIIRYDGLSWKVQMGGAANDLYALTGDTAGLVAAGAAGEVITNFGGGLSSDKVATGAVRDTATLANGDTLAVGESGLITARDESGWTDEDSGTGLDLFGVWTGESLSVAVGAKGMILHRTSTGWSPQLPAVDEALYAVWGASDTDITAVGEWTGSETVVAHYDGTEWTAQNVPSLNAELRDITGFSSGLRVAVGGGGVIVEATPTGNGGAFKKMQSPTSFSLHGVWGSDPDNIWAVGNVGAIVRRIDGAWTNVLDTPTKVTLYDVWGRSTTEVYAVGAGGAMLRYDGVEWTFLRSSTTAAIRGVWGLGPDDIYAVGAKGTILHFDGQVWTQQVIEDEIHGADAVAVTDQLHDVWGRSADDIYAVGTAGAIIHLTVDEATGQRLWQKEPQPDLNVTLRGIWGEESVAWMVGRTGNILAYSGGSPEAEVSGNIATLYDVLGFPGGRMVAVGDLGTVLRRELVPVR